MNMRKVVKRVATATTFILVLSGCSGQAVEDEAVGAANQKEEVVETEEPEEPAEVEKAEQIGLASDGFVSPIPPSKGRTVRTIFEERGIYDFFSDDADEEELDRFMALSGVFGSFSWWNEAVALKEGETTADIPQEHLDVIAQSLMSYVPGMDEIRLTDSVELSTTICEFMETSSSSLTLTDLALNLYSNEEWMGPDGAGFVIVAGGTSRCVSEILSREN